MVGKRVQQLLFLKIMRCMRERPVETRSQVENIDTVCRVEKTKIEDKELFLFLVVKNF